MGAKRLKKEHNLPCSHQAIRRVLKSYGLIQKRCKKHKKKKDLATLKQRWKLFGQLSMDTKDLKDIASLKAFHRQVAACQAYYNLVRPSIHKKTSRLGKLSKTNGLT